MPLTDGRETSAGGKPYKPFFVEETEVISSVPEMTSYDPVMILIRHSQRSWYGPVMIVRILTEADLVGHQQCGE